MLCISGAYAVARCPSGWVSVTFVYCAETAKDTATVTIEYEQETVYQAFEWYHFQ